MSRRELPPYTLKHTAMVQQLLYQFHSRAIQERDYQKAKRFALLISEIERNSRSKLDPMKYPAPSKP